MKRRQPNLPAARKRRGSGEEAERKRGFACQSAQPSGNPFSLRQGKRFRPSPSLKPQDRPPALQPPLPGPAAPPLRAHAGRQPGAGSAVPHPCTCWEPCAGTPQSGCPAAPASPGTPCRRKGSRRQSRWWCRGAPGSGAQRTAQTGSPPSGRDTGRSWAGSAQPCTAAAPRAAAGPSPHLEAGPLADALPAGPPGHGAHEGRHAVRVQPALPVHVEDVQLDQLPGRAAAHAEVEPRPAEGGHGAVRLRRSGVPPRPAPPRPPVLRYLLPFSYSVCAQSGRVHTLNS